MASFMMNICISVEDYLELKDEDGNDIDWSDAAEEAFEVAKEDPEGALQVAIDELTAANIEGVYSLGWGSAKFDEFDSNNASHAGAHWTIEVTHADEEYLRNVWRQWYYWSNNELTEDEMREAEAEAFPS